MTARAIQPPGPIPTTTAGGRTGSRPGHLLVVRTPAGAGTGVELGAGTGIELAAGTGIEIGAGTRIEIGAGTGFNAALLAQLVGPAGRVVSVDIDDDIVDAAERIWVLLGNYKEVVEALESTNESVIAHQQGDVLRILTVIATIALPLTFVTGVFGMNVLYPGEGTSAGFWAIMAILFAALVGMAAIFRWKRWL